MPKPAPIELTWPELHALATLALQRISELPMPALSQHDQEALIDFTRRAAVLIGGTGRGLLIEATDAAATVAPATTETD
ncbi:MAG: hypothetical protein KF727_15300 [Microbacteriaceae bacterium]|nr:hypothetical protein [Microbacteriaceae bacterium]